MHCIKIEQLRQLYADYLKVVPTPYVETRAPLRVKRSKHEKKNAEKLKTSGIQNQNYRHKLKASKLFSPRKIAIKASFGKIPHGEIKYCRSWNGTNVIGVSEHTATIDGCTCHEGYNVFPNMPEKNEPIDDMEIRREIVFRIQENTMNAKMCSLADTDVENNEYKILDL